MADPRSTTPLTGDAGDPGPVPESESRSLAEVSNLPELYQPATEGLSRTNESGAAVLAARVEAEVKAYTLLALARPRNVERFRLRLLEACNRTAFAQVARYAKPIGGVKVYGLSIRFAEECARHYGNLNISSGVVSEDDERRVVECCVVDLEVNLPWRSSVVVPKTVERKRVQQGDDVVRWRKNSKGDPVAIVRATDDQVFTTQNAMTSKAIRNLILNHIPSEIREEAERTIIETQRTEVRQDPGKYRRKLVDAFFEVGVTPEQLAEYLGKKMEDATEAELHMLKSIGEGIRQNEGTWAEVMEERRAFLAKREPGTGGTGKGATERLRDAIKKP
jgi:hypothetical protein